MGIGAAMAGLRMPGVLAAAVRRRRPDALG
jgi:hypothetical protein